MVSLALKHAGMHTFRGSPTLNVTCLVYHSFLESVKGIFALEGRKEVIRQAHNHCSVIHILS